MNRPQSKTMPGNAPQLGCWSLEVVRGRVVGHHYALEPGETVVGNALNGTRGLDLVDQEGSSPRKMAGRQAALTASGQELAIRDLDTPGGTFVNQQRLLAGQTRRLMPGDVIQLGSVQIRVTHAPVPSAAPSTEPTKPPGAAAKAVAATPKPASTTASPAPKSAAPTASPAPKTVAPTPAPSPAQKPVAPAAPPSSGAPGRLSSPFLLAGGAQCRTWDDFLVVAAQNWSALRDELTSGRLAGFLRHIQRPELVPLAGSSRSPDDQLDDWLARIPASASSSPELDVHPENLIVRAASGGGITQQTLRITNVGYRLLRCSARVDPPATGWLRLRPEQDGRPFQTIDQTDLYIELELPETIDRPLIAQIVIEGNGGTRRVGVRVERPGEQIVVPGSADAFFAAPTHAPGQLGQVIAGVAPVSRIVIGCAVAVALRAMAMLLNKMPLAGASATLTEPRLASVGVLLAAAGMVAGLMLATRRGDVRDFPVAALAGGLIGVLAGAIWFAVLQTVEPALGSWSNSIGAIGIASAALGVVLASLSLWVFPYRSNEPEVAR
jgi:FHA domain